MPFLFYSTARITGDLATSPTTERCAASEAAAVAPNYTASQTLLAVASWISGTALHGVFDLMPYAGQSIVLHFGVTNDGAGGQTAMVVDNASLVVDVLPYRVNLPLVLKSLP